MHYELTVSIIRFLRIRCTNTTDLKFKMLELSNSLRKFGRTQHVPVHCVVFLQNQPLDASLPSCFLHYATKAFFPRQEFQLLPVDYSMLHLAFGTTQYNGDVTVT